MTAAVAARSVVTKVLALLQGPVEVGKGQLFRILRRCTHHHR